MILNDLYADETIWWLPFQLLQEREPNQNISHKRMPSWDEHCDFIRSSPHQAWYWFASDHGQPAGCVYLSKDREIGIGVLKQHRGHGLAKQAIQELMTLHPGRFLANIHPQNSESTRLFHKLGFHFLQVTYERP